MHFVTVTPVGILLILLGLACLFTGVACGVVLTAVLVMGANKRRKKEQGDD